MSNEELEKIVDAIRTGYQLRSESIADHMKLLRSIEIATLREAREVVERAVARYSAAVADNTEGDDYVRFVALEKLDKKIMELSLR